MPSEDDLQKQLVQATRLLANIQYHFDPKTDRESDIISDIQEYLDPKEDFTLTVSVSATKGTHKAVQKAITDAIALEIRKFKYADVSVRTS